jgi:hypothetical protein
MEETKGNHLKKGRGVETDEKKKLLATLLVPCLSNPKGYKPKNCVMARSEEIKHPQTIMDAVDRTKGKLEDYLEDMDADGLLGLGFRVNPYKTPFRHHFKLGINFFSLGHLKADRAAKAGKYDSPEGFIRHLFRAQQEKPYPGLWLIGDVGG